MPRSRSKNTAGIEKLPDPIVRSRPTSVSETLPATRLSQHICSLVVLGDEPVPLEKVLSTFEPRPTMEQLIGAFEVIVSDGSVIVESWRFKKRSATVERCVQRLTQEQSETL